MDNEGVVWNQNRMDMKCWKDFPLQAPTLDYSLKNNTLPVFASDKTNGKRVGAKEYVTSGYKMFWLRYSSMMKEYRRFYEIMLPDVPSHMHIDLEFYYKSNPELTHESGTELTCDFIYHCVIHMQELSYIKDPSEVRIVTLDSSNDYKCSKHFIFKIRDGESMFKNNYHCGAFMRTLAKKIVEKEGNPKDNRFFLRGEKAEDLESNSEKTEFIADLAIYTIHRCFRILGSSKLKGGYRPLVLSGGDYGEINARDKWELKESDFYDSLVQLGAGTVEILTCLESDGSEPISTSQKRLNHPGFSVSVLPKMSNFVPKTHQITVGNEPPPPFTGGIARAIEEEWMDGMVTFYSFNSKYKTMRFSSSSLRCRVKEKFTQGRIAEHSSNHIYFCVNLRTKTFCQACFSDHASCRIENEDGELEVITTKDYNLPLPLHKEIDDFFTGLEDNVDSRISFAKDFISCMDYCSRIPNELRI